MGETRKTVCIIGAGFSGIGAAVKLKTRFHNVDFTIFDENKEVGGTWAVHTYPNCGSDVPVHLYSFSFEQKSDWSNCFGSQKDIQEYFQQVCVKYELYKHTKFSNQVFKLEWKEIFKQWRVSVLDKSKDTVKVYNFDFIIAGPGPFRRANIPEIYKNFKGPIIHTSEWNDTVGLNDETIAIVGCGTSAIQVVPAVVPIAKKLYAFQRRPAWVIPKPEFKISPLILWIFQFIPFAMTLWRVFIYLIFEFFFFAFRKDSPLYRFGVWLSKTHLKRQIPNNPELRKALSPDYPLTCKRMGLSNEYWSSLAKPNVKVVRETIANVTDDSIVTLDGEEYKINVIILATGYAVQNYFDPVEVIGTNNFLLSEHKEDFQHYLGIMTHHAPNFFFVLGPNAGVLHSTNVFMIETQVNWICGVLKEMIKKDLSRVQVKRTAEEEHMKFTDEEMKPLIYTNPACSSWYTSSTGRVNAFFSNNCTTYWNRTRNVDFSKLELS